MEAFFASLQFHLVPEHLPNVKTRFYCPRAFLSLDFLCRDDVS